MVRLSRPQTAPELIRGRPEFWLTRPGAGGDASYISTISNLQVRVFDRFVIIDPMDDKVDGTQYKYVLEFLNGTTIYETNWMTARLGSES